MFLLVLLFSSCGKRVALPPEEVVRRAVIRSNTVESVAASVSAGVVSQDASTLSGSFIVQSVIRSGGQAWNADASFHIETAMHRGLERASGRIVIVSPGTGRTYLRLESAEGVLGKLLRQSFTGSTSGWMFVGQQANVQAPPRQAPDPAVLLSYADALTVTEDLGFAEADDGRTLYHYRVALKPETLSSLPAGGTPDAAAGLSASGEMWIDADNFSLSRVIWHLRGVPTSLGLIDIRIDALFSDYDSASLIQTPAGTASSLPLESIFATFSS